MKGRIMVGRSLVAFGLTLASCLASARADEPFAPIFRDLATAAERARAQHMADMIGAVPSDPFLPLHYLEPEADRPVRLLTHEELLHMGCLSVEDARRLPRPKPLFPQFAQSANAAQFQQDVRMADLIGAQVRGKLLVRPGAAALRGIVWGGGTVWRQRGRYETLGNMMPTEVPGERTTFWQPYGGGSEDLDDVLAPLKLGARDSGFFKSDAAGWSRPSFVAPAINEFPWEMHGREFWDREAMLSAIVWDQAPVPKLEAAVPASQPPASSPAGATDPDAAAQKALCFPPDRFARVSTHDLGGAVVWTDLPELPKPLEQELKKTLALLTEWLAEPPAKGTATSMQGQDAPVTHARTGMPRAGGTPATRPVCLALYATRKDYQELWPRVGRLYAGQFPEITTQGYSYRVLCATSAQDADAAGAWLGVVCHELAHVWLYQRTGLANDGNWLTEGIATALQMRLFPASADRREFAERLERGRCLPLKRLMDQERIEPKDRWQAGTLVELLLAEYAGKLSAVARAFNDGRSASAIVADVLGTDFQTLERRWARRVKADARQ